MKTAMKYLDHSLLARSLKYMSLTFSRELPWEPPTSLPLTPIFPQNQEYYHIGTLPSRIFTHTNTITLKVTDHATTTLRTKLCWNAGCPAKSSHQLCEHIILRAHTIQICASAKLYLLHHKNSRSMKRNQRGKGKDLKWQYLWHTTKTLSWKRWGW